MATEQAILDAAEVLFAEKGFDGTTLRDIAKAAEVNLAAAHYHHGDKQTLYVEVLRRRLNPVNQARLARLDAAIIAAGESPVPIEHLLEIFAGPLFELYGNPHGGAAGARLIGRSLAEPLAFLEPELATRMQPLLARFAQALRRHCTALSAEEYLWRFTFVVGALHHTLATMHQVRRLTQGICRDDAETAQRHFVEFARDVFATAVRRPVS